MSPIILLSIFLTKLQLFNCNYLEAEANYKPKAERNNIVNKGVWLRNNGEKLFEKSSLGNFVFRPSSLDADRLLQTNFDAFADNVMEEVPFVSAFVGRTRRSTDYKRKRHPRKSMKSKNLKYSVESTKEPNVKPTSVFQEYPYEVASLVLLNNNRNKLLSLIHDNKNETKNNTTVSYKDIDSNGTKNKDEKNKTEEIASDTSNTASKRNRKHNSEVDKNERNRKQNIEINNNETLELVEDFNKTDDTSKTNRDIFDRDDRIWHQNAPVPDSNVYTVVPKDKTKVTERGLIRVISMLTKTFKKIMRQHNEVKLIYDKFNTMNEDFINKVNDMNSKFLDFDSKYSDMIQFNDRVKVIEEKLIKEEKYLNTKHKEMEHNILEFENQQKKFLDQQKQFYAVQKLMLAQNEKIQIKQNAIAKTQSEISHKQNYFARILKKSKQMFVDNKKLTNNTEVKENVIPIQNTATKVDLQTPNAPSESIKLSLFSIPTKNKLPNQDDLIIKEKDQRTIDDLVYKYYFNNTFIDNLMKSKILNNYASNTNSIEIARNTKNKRDGLETTLLLPISSKDGKNRVRRWASFNSNRKRWASKNDNAEVLKITPELANAKRDPFFNMANSFCNEIGQNSNAQSLNWCIEKALRRLRFMDKKLFSQPVTVMKKQKPQTLQKVTTEKPPVTVSPFASPTVWLATSLPLHSVSTPLYAVTPQEIFFPDNEELESNLKQYDLTPDTEGNVYYDGSLTLSDIGRTVHSEGLSDILPEVLTSNSRDQRNPIVFDLQSKRRAYMNSWVTTTAVGKITRINQDIMNKMKFRKL